MDGADNDDAPKSESSSARRRELQWLALLLVVNLVTVHRPTIDRQQHTVHPGSCLATIGKLAIPVGDVVPAAQRHVENGPSLERGRKARRGRRGRTVQHGNDDWLCQHVHELDGYRVL